MWSDIDEIGTDYVVIELYNGSFQFRRKVDGFFGKLPGQGGAIESVFTVAHMNFFVVKYKDETNEVRDASTLEPITLADPLIGDLAGPWSIGDRSPFVIAAYHDHPDELRHKEDGTLVETFQDYIYRDRT